ncbi:MAG: C4-dicarboxylate transporter DcuC, partial [Duodenibacillus sp.]|nr:C4-dicarboxylate transporter DcuC [Duodenibacillus sp.]
MFGVIITLLVIAAVAWCIIKSYYPTTVLLLAGLAFLVIAALMGVDPVGPKSSTHFLGFDFFQAFVDKMKGRLPGLGLNIMWIAGFSMYMDKIGASKALVKLCVKPLSAIRSPYVLLAMTYVIGQFMALFINSAVGLGLLLMASVYPLLIALGASRFSAAAVIASTCCLDLGPSSSNSLRAADLLKTDVGTYFVMDQLPVALCVIAAVALGHYAVQKFFDRRDGVACGSAASRDSKADLEKAFEGAGPGYYALLPMVPLFLLIIFCPLVCGAVKMSLQTAIVISILFAFAVDMIATRRAKEAVERTKAVFEGMGKVFTSTVALICCAELFALGMTKVGGITTMIQAAASMQSAGVWLMLGVMITIMVLATVV